VGDYRRERQDRITKATYTVLLPAVLSVGLATAELVHPPGACPSGLGYTVLCAPAEREGRLPDDSGTDRINIALASGIALWDSAVWDVDRWA